jgi:enoyl-CoA hydratase
MSTTDTAYETVLLERHDRVALVTLNRPKALNALSLQVMEEITALLAELDKDPGVGAIVITGSAKAFAAGADIKEMASQSYMDMYAADWFAGWDAIGRVRTPIVTAVAGYALGGGCELAMMGDVLLAADTAVFGQPEIKLGVMPGMGGSQRLARAVGKPKAMEMCLTGRNMKAEEAERAGHVSRIVPADDLIEDALKTAATIASMSKPIAQMCKEAVNRTQEVSLSEGVLFERRVFHAMFATEDQTEGMAAFVEKRQAEFGHR